VHLILRRSLIFIALMVAGLVLYAVWFDIKADRYDETAVPYLRAAIPELTSWRYERLDPLLSAEARLDFGNKKMRDAYRGFERLGELVSMEKPQYLGHAPSANLVQGGIEIVDYQVEVQFTSGPATIKLRLLADGESYHIHHFGIYSEVFAEE
jgi:hypothetical protein